jgi:hypothetical protein
MVAHPARIEARRLGRDGDRRQVFRVERAAVIRKDHTEVERTHQEKLANDGCRPLRTAARPGEWHRRDRSKDASARVAAGHGKNGLWTRVLKRADWSTSGRRSAHALNEPADLRRTGLGVFHHSRMAQLGEHNELRHRYRGIDRLDARASGDRASGSPCSTNVGTSTVGSTGRRSVSGPM